MKNSATNLDLRLAYQILTFRNNSVPVMEQLHNEYTGLMLNRYEIFTTELSEVDISAATKIREIQALIPEEKFNKTIISPMIGNVLKKYNARNIIKASTLIRGFINAELVSPAVVTGTGMQMWTSKGDKMVIISEDMPTESISFFQLKNDIVIDLFGPGNTALKKINDEPVIEFEISEADDVYNKIESAVKPIYSTSFYDMLSFFVDVIVVKKQSTSKSNSEFASSTISDLLRQVNLAAYDLQSVSNEEIIDSIIHESIHTLLGTINEITPWMPVEDEHPKVLSKIVSPWTGNTVLVQAMLHAVFVWYGLFHFWHQQMLRGAYNQNYITKRLAMIQAGFRKFNPLEYFQSSELNLSNDVYSVYQYLKEHIDETRF